MKINSTTFVLNAASLKIPGTVSAMSPPAANQGLAIEAEADRCYRSGDVRRALVLAREALYHLGEAGDRAGVARCVQTIGFLQFQLSDIPGALVAYGQALRLYQRDGDRKGEMVAHSRLAEAYQHTGDHAEALACLYKALTIAKGEGHLASVGVLLNNIGVSHGERGDGSAALTCYARALRIRRELGDLDGEAATLHNIGAAHVELGRYHEALAALERARSLRRAAGDTLGLARTLLWLGILQTQLQQAEAATACYDEAWRLAAQGPLDSPGDEAAALHNLGIAALARGQAARALRLLEQSAQILIRAGMCGALAKIFHQMALAHQMLEQVPQALYNWARAKAIYEKLGDRAALAATLLSIGATLSQQGQLAQAGQFLAKALRHQEALGDTLGQQQTRVLLLRLREMQDQSAGT
ncbi:tetratricopeptide repeat protein [Rugamonas aquatica]|nr:tetratricopeptide repeat protein [Rugamonas aquatica]